MKLFEKKKKGDDTELDLNALQLNVPDSKQLEKIESDLSCELFVPSEGLTSEEVEGLQNIWGPNALEEKTTPKWKIFLFQLWGPMPCLIWIAIIIEAAIQNFIDMGVLLGLQFINAFIGWYETTKAGDAVAALKASLKPQATVKRDGKWNVVDASTLVPGDMVLLASGSAVPADCKINSGIISVDQSALTGESLPITCRAGDDVLMGSTVTRGEVEGTVMTTGMHTFFGKTASMLNQKDDLGNLQKILLRITVTLTVLSLLLCSICFIYLMIKKESFKDSISFAVVVLVASIPIAIEIVSTATLAVGSRQLSAKGAIVSRLTAIEEMAGMNMLCSDKTGTLTLNKMVIQEDTPVYAKGYDQQSILQMAALAAKWKEPARDALDTLVLNAADLPALDVYEQLDFLPFDPAIKRTEGTLKGPDGNTFKITKGAPQIVLDLCYNKAELEYDVKKKIHEFGMRGIRSLAVARFENDKWFLLGLLTFLDPPRPDTKDTLEKAMALGVDVKMITGDQRVIAVETSRVLSLGTNVETTSGLPSLNDDGSVPDVSDDTAKFIINADGFAEVFPEHKYMIVEVLKRKGFSCGMTGDGVNDAPALKKANVGIAVAGATDAARAAADIVLTDEGLSVIVDAIYIARKIFQRVKSFINYRVAATLQLLVFFFIAVLALHPVDYGYKAGVDGLEEDIKFFKMPVLMLMLITILNDGTLISIGYDNVKPSNRPEKWNLKVLFIVSTVLGAVACLSSLLLLHWALEGHSDPNGVWRKIGLPALPYGKIITMMYLKISVSDFLTLFSARTVSFFFTQRPALVLFLAACFSLMISTVVACTWPEDNKDEVPILGLARGGYEILALWVWLYCIVWWFIQDTCKVITYKLLFYFDVFGARTGALINMREFNQVEESKFARASVGIVEQKLLNKKINSAKEAVLLEQEKSSDPLKYNDLLKQLDSTKEEYHQQLEGARASLQLPPRRSSYGGQNTARRSVGSESKSRGSVHKLVRASIGAMPSHTPENYKDIEANSRSAVGGLEITALHTNNMSNDIVEKIQQVTDSASKADEIVEANL